MDRKPTRTVRRFMRLLLAFPVAALGGNYEVYPGSAFYLTQMLDRSRSFVADQSNGLYHHPVGFSDLDVAQETTYTSHFTNRFAMVEGEHGQRLDHRRCREFAELMTSYGSLRSQPFQPPVVQPGDLAAALVRNNAAQGAPTYQQMLAPTASTHGLGWNDPLWNYARLTWGLPDASAAAWTPRSVCLSTRPPPIVQSVL